MTQHKIGPGIALAASGIVVLVAMDSSAKALGESLTTFQIVFARCLGAALWLALFIAVTRGEWPSRSNFWRQLLRAVMLVVTAGLFFYAVPRLPLAVVGALGMTAPLYVTLIGAVVFRERIPPAAWAGLALGAAGSAVIIFGGGAMVAGWNGADPLAWLAALLAPLCYAVTLVILKHHAEREAPAAMTMAQTFLAAVLVLPLAAQDVAIPTGTSAVLTVLIGFFGATGFLLLINGLKRLPVTVFAVIDYSGLLWAGLFGFALFGEVPGPQLWLGGGLIIAACALAAHGARPARPQV
jgi:S-adenosylmethionine uptake transporter